MRKEKRWMMVNQRLIYVMLVGTREDLNALVMLPLTFFEGADSIVMLGVTLAGECGRGPSNEIL